MDSITLKLPKYIIKYQQHMGGVDHGYQNRVMGSGFLNVAQFKKCYKKAFFGFNDFSFLNIFTSWNL